MPPNRGVEQLVARWAHNPKVTGSSPVPATKATEKSPFLFLRCMPFHIYVLYSEAYDEIYVGYTADLAARILSHNQLAKKGYTTKFRPWRLFYTESFESKESALRREKELKSARGRKFVRDLIEKDYRDKRGSW